VGVYLSDSEVVHFSPQHPELLGAPTAQDLLPKLTGGAPRHGGRGHRYTPGVPQLQARYGVVPLVYPLAPP